MMTVTKSSRAVVGKNRRDEVYMGSKFSIPADNVRIIKDNAAYFDALSMLDEYTKKNALMSFSREKNLTYYLQSNESDPVIVADDADMYPVIGFRRELNPAIKEKLLKILDGAD